MAERCVCECALRLNPCDGPVFFRSALEVASQLQDTAEPTVGSHITRIRQSSGPELLNLLRRGTRHADYFSLSANLVLEASVSHSADLSRVNLSLRPLGPRAVLRAFSHPPALPHAPPAGTPPASGCGGRSGCP